MLASSVAAPAVTRFGKKAQGVSARKAISRVPVGGHKVQVRLLSTSSPDFHPLHRRDGGRRVCRSVRAARAGGAIPRGFDAIVLAASRPGRIHAPTATCGANPTRRPNPIPVSISRYVISDKFLGTEGIPPAHHAPEAHKRPDNNDTN